MRLSRTLGLVLCLNSSMTISITKPTVGAISGWGAVLNTALDTIVTEVNAIGTSGGALLTPTAVKTASYTAAAGDFVPVDTTSGAVTITLPTSPADKTQVAVKHVIQGGTNAVTIARGGSSNVFNKAGGSTSLSLPTVNQTMVVQYTSSTGIWYVRDSVSLAVLDGRYDATGAATTAAAAVLPTQTSNSGKLLTTDGSSASWVDPFNIWQPEDNNFYGSSMNPYHVTAAASTPVTGRITMARIKWRRTRSVQKLYLAISTAGAGLTSGQNLIALYTGAGVIISGTTSPDQSANWTTTGIILVTLGSPVSIPADPTGFIYGAALTVGTTPPLFRGSQPQVNVANAGLTTALAFGQDASAGNTSMPGTLTPSTMTGQNPWLFAVGP